MKAAIALNHTLLCSFYACTVVKLRFATEHKKKKKKKKKPNLCLGRFLWKAQVITSCFRPRLVALNYLKFLISFECLN